MNASFLAQGLLLVAGLALTRPAWRGGPGTRAWRALVLSAGVGWVVVGFVPEDVNLPLHMAGALPVFLLGNVGLVLAGSSMRGSGMRAVRLYTLALGAVGLVSAVLFFATLPVQGLGIGVGTLERLAVFPLQVWALLTGGYLLRSKPGP